MNAEIQENEQKIKVDEEEERKEPNDGVREYTCQECGVFVSDDCANGIILYYFKKCNHEICMECIEVDPAENYPDIKCPVQDCNCLLMESEIEDIYGCEMYK